MREDTEFLLRIFKGDAHATELIQSLFSISHVWDDLIDKDKPVDDKSIHHAFSSALIGLNRNPFFRRWCDELLPLLEVSIINWKTANELEKSNDLESVVIAHFLRQSLLNVVIHVARIIGGSEWAESISGEVMIKVSPDLLSDYIREQIK